MSTNLHTREKERELRTGGEMRQPSDTQIERERADSETRQLLINFQIIIVLLREKFNLKIMFIRRRTLLVVERDCDEIVFMLRRLFPM